jgi:hypothetical protein
MDTYEQRELFDNLPPSATNTELRIGAGNDAPLSKAQRAFRRAKNRVEDIQNEIARNKQELEKCFTYYQENMPPVVAGCVSVQKEFIKLAAPFLFREDKSFSGRQLDMLANVLDYMLAGIAEHDDGFEGEIAEIAKKLEEILEPAGASNSEDELGGDYVEDEDDWGDENGENLKASKEELQEMFDKMGIDVDIEDIDFSMSEEEIFERIAQIMQKTGKKFPGRKPRKKTKKQLEKEERERQIAEVRAKNISTVYKQLARLFHPDLEPDPDKKQQKEELMKELTAAYEKGDLHTILRLELTWLQKEDGDITAMSDAKLDAYTAALKEQADELEWECSMIWENPRYREILRCTLFEFRSPSLLRNRLEQRVTELKEKALAMRVEVEAMRGSHAAKTLRMLVRREYEDLQKLRQCKALAPWHI